MNSPYEKYQGFTEGPWHNDDGTIWGRGSRYASKETTPDGFEPNQWNEVATLKSKFNYKTRDYERDEQHSNAGLIAAAPLLLQDCREMFETLRAVSDEELPEYAVTAINKLLDRIKERHEKRD